MNTKSKRIALVSVHSLWMILLVFFWMRQPFISDKEFGLTAKLVEEGDKYRWNKEKVKKKYLEKFFFINTSHSLEAYDEAPFDWSSNVITNRGQLLSVFKKLENHTDKFDLVFLDVYIDAHRNDSVGAQIDAELAAVISRLKKKEKVITVSNISDYLGSSFPAPRVESVDRVLTNKLVYEPNIFGDDLSGSAYYPPSLGKSFYRFQYQMKVDDREIKQASMLMYELAMNDRAGNPFLFDLFYKYENQPGVFQNITIPRMKLKDSDLKTGVLLKNKEGVEMEKPVVMNLNLLYDEDETLLEEIISHFPNQIIVIGDMNFIDNHETTGGVVAGPVVVANTLITLFEKENKLHFLYFVFLFFAFAAVSYFTFYPEVTQKLKAKKFKYEIIGYPYHYVMGKLNYFILFVTAILGLVIFKAYIYFFFSFFYVFFITRARAFINYVEEARKPKNIT